MKKTCTRKSCRYWSSPGTGIGNNCDYMTLTGKSRIAQIPDRKMRSDFDRCPLYEKGKRPKLGPVKFGDVRTKYDWALGAQMYKAGATDREIAEALGCTRENVKYWRRNHKLPPNTGRQGEV